MQSAGDKRLLSSQIEGKILLKLTYIILIVPQAYGLVLVGHRQQNRSL